MTKLFNNTAKLGTVSYFKQMIKYLIKDCYHIYMKTIKPMHIYMRVYTLLPIRAIDFYEIKQYLPFGILFEMDNVYLLFFRKRWVNTKTTKEN